MGVLANLEPPGASSATISPDLHCMEWTEALRPRGLGEGTSKSQSTKLVLAQIGERSHWPSSHQGGGD